MGPSKPNLKIQKNEKIETTRNASNDTESIPKAPKDFQKLELMHFFEFRKILDFDHISANSMIGPRIDHRPHFNTRC